MKIFNLPLSFPHIFVPSSQVLALLFVEGRAAPFPNGQQTLTTNDGETIHFSRELAVHVRALYTTCARSVRRCCVPPFFFFGGTQHLPESDIIRAVGYTWWTGHIPRRGLGSAECNSFSTRTVQHNSRLESVNGVGNLSIKDSEQNLRCSPVLFIFLLG